ncbi:MAG TPA: NADH-quinone oxidoreductase subunit L [Deinococcales bacterium]|nr:NADH-quinone oxidoreductase subunit L [Deinococcales bacterium]
MTFSNFAYLIPALPAAGWLIVTVFNRLFPGRAAAWFATLLMAVSAVLAIGLFAEVRDIAPVWNNTQLEAQYGQHETTAANQAEAVNQALERPAIGQFPITEQHDWIKLSGQEGLPFGFYFDQLTATMVLMVTIVAFFIHLFSIGYMAGEDRYSTFFGFINLFAAAMLAMVMSKNLVHVLLFWEVMGVMSYLLIGFFYKKKSAQQAAKKAFLTVRVGDLAFMAALFWLYQRLGTLDIPTIIGMGQSGALAATLGTAATGMGLLFLLAAMGKSAQFPLHVWLPDAMEGPTPVSAMIHAATMVAAGVYLLARVYPILQAGNVLLVVAWVGGITALFAATMAPAMADAKKILAFSTLSQLGYMFLGLGVFGWGAALFHLLTHAFFKALLFLGSGSMIHGSGTQDIFEMDHLAKYQRWTLVTVWVGALSLMGFPLFAGFWSKDEILHAAQGANGALYAIGLITAVLTAFYTTRFMLIAFYKPATASPWYTVPWNQQGEPSLNMSAADVAADAALTAGHGPGVPHEQAETEHEPSKVHHPHESGPEMIVALVGLAIGSLVLGFSGSPIFGNWLQRFVYFGSRPEVVPVSAAWTGYLLSVVIVALGGGAAVVLYRGDHLTQRAPLWLTQVLQRRYYIDDFYYAVVTRIAQAPTAVAAWFDRNIVDGLVDLTGGIVAAIGELLRRVQTGSVQLYAWMVILGAAALAFAFSFAQGAIK